MSVWQLDGLLDEEHLKDPQTATSLTIHTLLTVFRLFGVLPFPSKVKSTAGRERLITMVNVGLIAGVGNVLSEDSSNHFDYRYLW